MSFICSISVAGNVVFAALQSRDMARLPRLPKLPRTPKETHTIKLKAVFASLDGKSSDDDAARFRALLDELIRKFRAKSEFTPKIIEETVTYKSEP